jgi:hypothetical protein
MRRLEEVTGLCPVEYPTTGRLEASARDWLWNEGVAGYYGGSTQVHLGPGPAVDEVHAASLRAALLTGERLEITEPGESEDFGRDWKDPSALTDHGDREPTEPWTWAGPSRRATGRTWGGCAEVLQWIQAAEPASSSQRQHRRQPSTRHEIRIIEPHRHRAARVR